MCAGSSAVLQRQLVDQEESDAESLHPSLPAGGDRSSATSLRPAPRLLPPVLAVSAAHFPP